MDYRNLSPFPTQQEIDELFKSSDPELQRLVKILGDECDRRKALGLEPILKMGRPISPDNERFWDNFVSEEDFYGERL